MDPSQMHRCRKRMIFFSPILGMLPPGSVAASWIVAIAIAVVVLIEAPPAAPMRLYDFSKLALEHLELARNFAAFCLRVRQFIVHPCTPFSIAAKRAAARIVAEMALSIVTAPPFRSSFRTSLTSKNVALVMMSFDFSRPDSLSFESVMVFSGNIAY